MTDRALPSELRCNGEGVRTSSPERDLAPTVETAATTTAPVGALSRRRPAVKRHAVAGILMAADGMVSQAEIIKALRLPKDFPNAKQAVQMAVCRLVGEDGYGIERVIAYRLVRVP